MQQPDWAAIREEFPALANRVFLNTATYGQLPRCATAAVCRHFERRDELACADFLSWFDDADHIRNSIARLVNATPADVAFIPNAATALGWLVAGLDWQPGDEFVTLTEEFPNNIYFPALLENRGIRLIETDWANLLSVIGPRTRLVLVSSASYITGFVPPLTELGQYLRERGVLLYVDGTQTVGALRFDFQSVRPDMLAVHGYKWLLSPNGAGFACIGPELRPRLRPTVVGWRSHREWRDVDQLHHGPPEFVDSAEKYEGGMLNFPSLYGMGASVDLMLELGPEAIEERVLQLAERCRGVLERAGGAVAYPGSPILAAKFEGVSAGELSALLKARGILTSARHGRLRVSVHFYNNEVDIEALDAALRDLVK